MLILSQELANKPLLSLRTATKVGTIKEPLINPHNLHIDAFICQNENKKILYLLDINVRENSRKGIIINDYDDLGDEDDLLRLKPLIDNQFQLINKTVYSGNRKIGKVYDYATDKDSLYIQKLYLKPNIISIFSAADLVIDRSSITEVTDQKIVISGPEEKSESKSQILAID